LLVSSFFAVFRLKLHSDPLARITVPILISNSLDALIRVVQFTWINAKAEQSLGCQVYAFFRNYFSLSVAFWQAAVATWMAVMLFSGGNPPPISFDISCNLIWVAAAIISSAGFWLHQYGPATEGAYCWIESVAWRVYLELVWIIVVMLYLFVIHVAMGIYSWKTLSQASLHKEKIAKFCWKLMGYPVVFFFWMDIGLYSTFVAIFWIQDST